MPLDVLVVDMDWHTPHAWTGYTWNRELFPDPPGLSWWVHDRGLRATLNLHPAQGVQPFEEIYPRFAEAMGVDPESRRSRSPSPSPTSALSRTTLSCCTTRWKSKASISGGWTGSRAKLGDEGAGPAALAQPPAL